MKIRRADVETAQTELNFYDGLNSLSDQVTEIEAQWKQAEELGRTLSDLQSLLSRRNVALSEIQNLESAPVGMVPTPDKVQEIQILQQSLHTATDLLQRLKVLQHRVQTLAPIEHIPTPDKQGVIQTANEARTLATLHGALTVARARVSKLEKAHNQADTVKVPNKDTFDRVSKVKSIIEDMATLNRQYKAASQQVQQLDIDLKIKQGEHTLSVSVLQGLLGGMGECPLCHSACSHLP